MLKDLVLAYLEDHAGVPSSGNEIATIMGVSRTAVWKIIHGLKNDGYRIEGTPKKGYLYSTENDFITLSGIRNYLKTTFLGNQIKVYPTLASTNETAKEFAADHSPEGLVIIADNQSSGKGRFTRSFFSPKGVGIYMSILLRPATELLITNLITVAAAVAVAQAVEDVTQKEVNIKWVNDLLMNKRKFCGILTEASIQIETGLTDYIVLGIGINVNNPAESFPSELSSIATSLFSETGQKINRNQLIAQILNHLEYYYKNLAEKNFLPEYRKRLSVLGKPITVIRGNQSENAVAIDIDDNAALLVADEFGTKKKLNSGEISIRSLESGK